MIPRPKPERFRLRRTMMFMNAQKPGLIKDAYIYGCDSIMLDLEDAVAENQKDAARFSLYHALKTIDFGNTEMVVRINPLNTPYGKKDVEAVVSSSDAFKSVADDSRGGNGLARGLGDFGDRAVVGCDIDIAPVAAQFARLRHRDGCCCHQRLCIENLDTVLVGRSDIDFPVGSYRMVGCSAERTTVSRLKHVAHNLVGAVVEIVERTVDVGRILTFIENEQAFINDLTFHRTTAIIVVVTTCCEQHEACEQAYKTQKILFHLSLLFINWL